MLVVDGIYVTDGTFIVPIRALLVHVGLVNVQRGENGRQNAGR